jgi:hypothetical protein
MKGTIYLEIGTSFLVATLRQAIPGRGRRLARAVSRKLQWRKSGEETPAPPLPAEESQAGIATEIASWAPGATRAENITAMLEACAQALQALRAHHTEPLDGCHLVVRAGASASYVGITPMDFSSPSARSGQQLRIVAKALAQEAVGAEAAAHEVRWSIQADQAHLCVITLESALIAGLQALAQAQRMKLVSCQPALVELLGRELEKSRRQRDARTLVWTECKTSERHHPAVTFVRVVNGSAVNAWRTVMPTPSVMEDRWLQPALSRFLIASGAADAEQVVRCVWPAHTEAQSPAALELAV